ncbi:MAG: hypothetical protein IJN34_05480 [Clostridia bacterium]|nr:hypothetical protein [Clostridia bacterium]
MKNRKLIKILGIAGGGIAATLLIPILLYFGVWGFIWLCAVTIPDPPPPAVEQGEFPFKLVYEIDGERKEIEDTLVIEFEDSKGDFEVGDIYYWKRYFKNDIFNDETYEIVLAEEEDYRVWFELGSSEYYMGIDDPLDKYGTQPGEIGVYPETLPINDETLLEYYGIKIIEKYVSPPIEAPSK